MRAWIEISSDKTYNKGNSVALFMRAWIEIYKPLKSHTEFEKVALFMRAWIEMHNISFTTLRPYVALFMRAWIEIMSISRSRWSLQSPSS